MRLITVAFAAILLASALAADDAAVKNATDLLASLKELKKDLYGKADYKVMYKGRKIGGMHAKVSEGKHEDAACYRVDMEYDLSLGPKWFKATSTAFVSPGLKLLYHSARKTEDGAESEHDTIVRTPEGYVLSEFE
jgi:hypothetical protein